MNKLQILLLLIGILILYVLYSYYSSTSSSSTSSSSTSSSSTSSPTSSSTSTNIGSTESDTTNSTITTSTPSTVVIGSYTPVPTTVYTQTGGVYSTDGTYNYLTFTNTTENQTKTTGTFSFTYGNNRTLYFLVVAGGGGGGEGGGGGGGGGQVVSGYLTLTKDGSIYNVDVGGGGSYSNGTNLTNGSNGEDSVLSGSAMTTVTAKGGGLGSSTDITEGISSRQGCGLEGGNGGGASYYAGTQSLPSGYKPSQGGKSTATISAGYSGGDTDNTLNKTFGYPGGGGGGAGGKGNNGGEICSDGQSRCRKNSGTGGIGFLWTINNTRYGAGGGGGSNTGEYDDWMAIGGEGGGGNGGYWKIDGINGTNGLGGGGGGGGGQANGGLGGNGTIIIAWKVE